MKKLLLIIIAFLFTSTLFGQSADGRYVSRMTQDGTLFFIMPQKIKNLTGIKKFEYDITLLTQSDSLTVNFTFESSLMNVPTDLKIQSGENTFPCTDYKPLFIDIKKNHYEIRITSKFSNDMLKTVVNNPTPPIFLFKQGTEIKEASYKEGAWRKDRKKLNDIYNLYLYSK